MNKAEIYDLLRTRGIWHEITEHKAVYNMAELTDVALPYPEADAKNLFVRDDKKRNYYLITVRGDKRVDLKEFRHKYGTRAVVRVRKRPHAGAGAHSRRRDAARPAQRRRVQGAALSRRSVFRRTGAHRCAPER